MKVFGHAEPGAPAEEIELEKPQLTGSEVLVRVTNSGVCHSDVHCQDGYFDLGSAGRRELTASGAQYPVVLGHEIVGEVLEVGPEATVQPGDTLSQLALTYLPELPVDRAIVQIQLANELNSLQVMAGTELEIPAP